MRSGTFIRALVGAAISIVALWFVLRGVDLARTAEVLSHADLRWIAVAAFFSSTDLALRALRWQRLLRPIATVRYLPMLGYLLIGYLANNVLPARLGELVRSHYLGDREGISRASALGTVVVERIVDLVAGVVASAVLVGAGVAGLFLVVLALGIVAHRLPGVDRIAAAVERWPQVRELASRLQGGLAVAGRPRTLAEALAVSAVAWTVAILAWAAVGQSIGLHLSIGQAALIAAGVALASAVPAGPSNLGTFELAAVEIGKAIGVPPDSAFALALIVHASSLVVTSVGGGVALARIGWVRRGDAADPVTPAG